MPYTAQAQIAPTQYIPLQDGVSLGYGAYSTLRAWIADGRLPAVKIGGRVKVKPEDLEALVQPKPARTGQAPIAAVNAAVARVVAEAPRLSIEQREHLAAILGGAR